MQESVARLLKFVEYRAIDTDAYNFILLESSSSTAEAREHQRRALASMDDPVRQSTRIQKVDDVFYWIGQDGYPTAMWVPKQAPPIAPNPPRTPRPLRAPQATRLHDWSEAKLNVVAPHYNANGAWTAYTPNPTTIYAITPGLNRVGHLMQAQDGANFTVEMQSYWDKSYDNYAYQNPNGNNLRNWSVHVLADIRKLIQRGNGPAAIVCGSRGGQETMLELTKHWRGLVFDFNGGFLTGCQREFRLIPDGIQVVSVLGQDDFFYHTRRPATRADFDLFKMGRLPPDFRDYDKHGPIIPRNLADPIKVITDETQFQQLVQRKLDFLSRCVGNAKSGQHILYASSMIDHGLGNLDGRSLILAVMQGRQHGGRTRDGDFVYKVSI